MLGCLAIKSRLYFWGFWFICSEFNWSCRLFFSSFRVVTGALIASTVLTSILFVWATNTIIFHFISSFPTTVNVPSPRVHSCDLRLNYSMGAEALLMCPCPGQLPGPFSGAVEKVFEGFSLGDRAQPDPGHRLRESLINQDSPGTTWTTVWCIYFILFWHASQLLAQPPEDLDKNSRNINMNINMKI